MHICSDVDSGQDMEKTISLSKYGKIRHIITWGKGSKGQDFFIVKP
jgi:hypothetical protein